MAHEYAQTVTDEWVSFPGGELEGQRPQALCPACREGLKLEALADGLSCFQCYRANLDRERAIAAAGQLDTGSEARFQFQLPLEAVNQSRLDSLRAARSEARTASVQGIGAYVYKRRRAQIAARHALQAIAAGLRSRLGPRHDSGPQRRQEMTDAIHAAEQQLPDAWLPFVVSR
jgi:hypothetical protein